MGKKGRKGADDWEKDFDALDEEGNLKEAEAGADEAAAPAGALPPARLRRFRSLHRLRVACCCCCCCCCCCAA